MLLRAGRNASPELIEAIRAQLGLDKGFWGQYWMFFKDLFFHFDLGYSYQNNISVKEQILDRVMATATLAFGAMIVWLAGRHPDRDPRGAQARALAGQAGDGHRARRDLGARLLARPRLAVPVLEGDRRLPDLRGLRFLPDERHIFTEPRR